VDRSSVGPIEYSHIVLVIEQKPYTTPLYTQAEAASIIGVPANTFRNWAHGYSYKTLGELVAVKEPLVTMAPEHNRLRVPFIGLAEAYVLEALRSAGIPMVRIRPAVEALKRGMGLPYALLSERLKTDGVEVLYDYAGDDAESQGGRVGLAVVRDKQLVFREAIEQYLRSVTYQSGFITSFEPRAFGDAVVRVDPALNAGQPSFVESGVRVEDVLRRIRAGEPIDEVSDDYGLDPDIVQRVASRD
jgi:uncharacterized protein (DUF433 family)